MGTLHGGCDTGDLQTDVERGKGARSGEVSDGKVPQSFRIDVGSVEVVRDGEHKVAEQKNESELLDSVNELRLMKNCKRKLDQIQVDGTPSITTKPSSMANVHLNCAENALVQVIQCMLNKCNCLLNVFAICLLD